MIPPLPAAELIVCADWSAHPTGRAAWAVDVGERAIFPLGERSRPWTLESVLAEARLLGGGDVVLVAVDAPLGAPASFLRAAGARDFIDWLARRSRRALEADPVTEPLAWSVECPFFRVRKGPGGLNGFVEAAAASGVQLWRRIDVLTRARSLFAVGIPGHVAPATRSLGRLRRLLHRRRAASPGAGGQAARDGGRPARGRGDAGRLIGASLHQIA